MVESPTNRTFGTRGDKVVIENGLLRPTSGVVDVVESVESPEVLSLKALDCAGTTDNAASIASMQVMVRITDLFISLAALAVRPFRPKS